MQRAPDGAHSRIRMSQLKQIHLQFSSLEDRLLLLVKNQELAEYRFWITRRFLKLLWPVLVKLLASNQNVRIQSDAQSRRTVMSFQHESALQESDFATAYEQEVSATPLGISPVLLARVQVKRKPDTAPILCLHPLEGEGIELAMSEPIVHSVCKLLTDAVDKAGWDLELRIASTRATSQTPQTIN